MSEPRGETCEDCFLPLAICICHPAVYDPATRREEILGRLEDLGKLIDDALKVGDIKATNPFSEGHGDSVPATDTGLPDLSAAPITNP